jgi:prepilin-type N-terminal cleavage/methylation domain-containing protein/prepilin-type processing-associated H-X9-DG protein
MINPSHTRFAATRAERGERVKRSPRSARVAGKRRSALSLLEVVVALAIFGILAGLLLVAINRVRDQAAAAACRGHLGQLGLAIHHYEAAHGRLPHGYVVGPFAPAGVPAGVSHGFWPSVLGMIEQEAVARQYRWDVSYNDSANRPAVTASVPVLLCPSSAAPPHNHWGQARADYGPAEATELPVDDDPPAGACVGALTLNGTVRLSDVTDGTATTLLLAETPAEAAWASPHTGVPARHFPGAGMHRAGSNVCMADGSVRLMRTSIGVRLIAALATRCGGEAVGGGEF